MCGINRILSPNLLKRGARASSNYNDGRLHHRGPDEQARPHDKRARLRLRPHPPLDQRPRCASSRSIASDRRYVLTVNASFITSKALRSKLMALGERLHLPARNSEIAIGLKPPRARGFRPRHLRGEFAVVLYDKEEDRRSPSSATASVSVRSFSTSPPEHPRLRIRVNSRSAATPPSQSAFHSKRAEPDDATHGSSSPAFRGVATPFPAGPTWMIVKRRNGRWKPAPAR